MENSMKPLRTLEKLECGSPVTIVAIGDSLTYGWMAEKGYLDFLGDMLLSKYRKAVLRIVNRGIPGDTAQGGLSRVQHDVVAEHPDCVLIQFGLNDAFSGYDPEDYGKNIQDMIDAIRRAQAAEIVLVTSVWLNNPGENRVATRFYEQLEIISRASGLSMARVHSYWKEKIAGGVALERLVQGDLVHPTVEGYRIMAEAIMEVFD